MSTKGLVAVHVHSVSKVYFLMFFSSELTLQLVKPVSCFFLLGPVISVACPCERKTGKGPYTSPPSSLPPGKRLLSSSEAWSWFATVSRAGLGLVVFLSPGIGVSLLQDTYPIVLCYYPFLFDTKTSAVCVFV